MCVDNISRLRIRIRLIRGLLIRQIRIQPLPKMLVVTLEIFQEILKCFEHYCYIISLAKNITRKKDPESRKNP